MMEMTKKKLNFKMKMKAKESFRKMKKMLRMRMKMTKNKNKLMTRMENNLIGRTFKKSKRILLLLKKQSLQSNPYNKIYQI